jgi:hypothetical protein
MLTVLSTLAEQIMRVLADPLIGDFPADGR